MFDKAGSDIGRKHGKHSLHWWRCNFSIIETVCAKQGFDPAEYNVKHQRTILDVQLPFRYANLPNNAKLELVKSDRARKESPTQLALQLPSGERLQHSFPPSASLWDVLAHWENQPESAHKGQLMAARPEGDGEILHPVCIYMRQEIVGMAALKSTSLHSLGLTGGKALIRLIHRVADIPIPDTSAQAKTQPEKVPTPSATKVESTSKPVSHSVIDSSIASQGKNKCNQQGQEDNQMEVDSNSSKMSVTVETTPQINSQTVTASGETAVRAKSVNRPQDRDTPMEVDASSSSERLPSIGGRMSAPQDMGARPKEEHPPITLTKEQEQLANEMGAALAQAIMQQRGAASTSSSSSYPPAPPPFADFKFPEPSVPSSTSSNQKHSAEAVKPCDRMPIVYNTGDGLPGDAQVGDVPEEFFDVTINDVRKMYVDLKNQSARMGEQVLETKTMKEARERREMQRYSKVVVRIHFSDRQVLQGFFRPQEMVEAVSEFVKSHLEDSTEKFYLYTTPPKNVLKDQKQTLFAAKLCPAAVVHFGTSSQKDHYLSEDILRQTETLMKADELVAKNIQTPHQPTSSTSQVPSYDIAGPSTSNSTTAGATGGELQVPSDRDPYANRRQGAASSAATSGKVPKWFKVGKK